jgi:DNA-binding transcriptional LysR family regulator
VESRRLDLNLLVTLDALLDEGSVTKAAKRLNLSQPALSASLAKLRRHFGDRLLVRAGNTYRLTPLAATLKPRTGAVLERVNLIFAAQSDFTPATTTHEFHVVMTDYGGSIFGRTLVDMFASEAPFAQLRIVHRAEVSVEATERMLATHLLVTVCHGFMSDLPHQNLYSDRWVVLGSVDNPTMAESMTIEVMETLPWVLVMDQPTGPMARQFRLAQVKPYVQVVTETFASVPELVVGSKRVALFPERLAMQIPAELGLTSVPFPGTNLPLNGALWWHPINEYSPEHSFLRDIVTRSARSATRQPARRVPRPWSSTPATARQVGQPANAAAR